MADVTRTVIAHMGLGLHHHLLILHLLLASVVLMMPVTTWLCVVLEAMVILAEVVQACSVMVVVT
ncbi:hypothetical protein [Dictyobacter kobayashii]|uniref:Uncharacterized protein n=1 Tax=Dictyobacter kobayashii TaxID=2014872 RepID=A0A402AVJ5_9CHLR|nr:hypothetical protein [Dictyobacter kobayashii]GCE23142.1 hypothetical protein KDK_69420 [Dictyobacter kobayashii]